MFSVRGRNPAGALDHVVGQRTQRVARRAAGQLVELGAGPVGIAGEGLAGLQQRGGVAQQLQRLVDLGVVGQRRGEQVAQPVVELGD